MSGLKNEDINGLDVKKGLSLVANNKTVYIKLLKSFIANAFCDQLIGAVNSGDLDQVRQKAHTFKGVAGNMHMHRLYELSRAIESDAKDGLAVSASDEIISSIVEENRLTLESVNMLLENPEILDSLN